MKLRGHSPNTYIHVSVSDLYNPTIGQPIVLHENRWTVSSYINVVIRTEATQFLF